ncbi:ARF7EP_C domain-containing protein [Trichonephila clavata]|uniref:ARF7EP_C domain-containing protein n=1 Tax=Trichonephila clavata TaxID=2740835 RepID=A0A8X6HE53_TRICU|nr:ARF7EP_C domain-containing protein [Trichonephila clavata]
MANMQGNMTLRERTDKPKVQDDLEVTQRELKKIEKLEAKAAQKKKKRKECKYDNNGIHIETGKDLCDCLKPNCVGCFMPCRKCSSEKCGHECRRNRNWEYQGYKIEGADVVKNPTIKWKKADEKKFDAFFDF